jgi:hypothetical protein
MKVPKLSNLELFSPITYAYYNVKNGLKNLWLYKGVVWRTREWDYYYLGELVEFKLKQMGNAQMLHNDINTGLDMHVLAEHIRTLIDNDFDDYEDYLVQKYGEISVAYEKDTESEFMSCTIKREKEHMFTKEEKERDINRGISINTKKRKIIEMKISKLLKNYQKWWY